MKSLTALLFSGVLLGQSWIQLSPSGTPPTILGTSSEAYDQPGNHLIVFNQDLVWVLTNANGLGGTPQWTQLSPAGPLPTPRQDASTVYDTINNRLIVFGGCANVFCVALNDVWVLTNANGSGGTPQWTQLNPSGGPPAARGSLAAAYDPGSNTMIIFGGDPFIGTNNFNDSWVLTNANGLGGPPQWMQLAPANTPLEQRYNMAFGYNPNTNKLVVTQGVGNYPAGLGFLEPSTWELDGANGTGTAVWTQLFPTGTPPTPRNGLEYDGAMDSVNNRLIMFGGSNGNPGFNDVWVLILPFQNVFQDAFQVGYAANLDNGNSLINITNNGASDPPGVPGTLCINVYAFDPSEEMLSCCTCSVTPNGLVSLSVLNSLRAHTLTGEKPSSMVIKLIATTNTGAACDASNVSFAQIGPGMRAWGTTLHALPGSGFGVTENKFSQGILSQAELAHLTSFCGFIEGNGTGAGICAGCSAGGL